MIKLTVKQRVKKLEYQTLDEILIVANSARGKSFGEIDQYNRLDNKNSKGILGQVIEESLFGYEINSNPEADFGNLETELKVTAIKQNKNKTISAKERLVLNIINYMDEVNKDFYTSSFWKKNKQLLLMVYEWKKDIERSNYIIQDSFLFTFPEKDLLIIQKDWEIIIGKVRKGLAHELSESDTQYLAACTKGANKNSVTKQPHSSIMAKQRAYSLKQSYLTAIFRERLNNKKLLSFTNVEELKEKSLQEILEEKFKPFYEKTENQISLELSLEKDFNSKNKLQLLISAILGVRGTLLNDIEEFAKSNIQFKTVRVNQSGLPKEHMSFKNINFNEVMQEDWENSYIKNFFEQTQILFVIFETNTEGHSILKKVKLWNMPESVIENQLYDYWSEIKDVLNKGVVIEKTNRGYSNNLPNASFNQMMHVRPKGKNAKDMVMLPDGQWITKQSYWLDRHYIKQIIDN